MGQQLSAEQKCYIRTLKQLLKASGAIASEDQIGKMLLTVFLCNPWFPKQGTLIWMFGKERVIMWERNKLRGKKYLLLL
jgi:hypothetical protein